MHITFVSNYINHHQIPVSDELYKLTGGEYTFIQTEPMEKERIEMGWDAGAKDKPYVKLFYEDVEGSKRLIQESDCVIFGGTEREELIIPRLMEGRFTIRYSERIYKEGRWKFISPRGLVKKYHDHIRFRKSNVYMLCSGAYVKGDFKIIGAYPGKMLKYGYFPKFCEYDDVHNMRRGNEKTNILWAARFIDWKHPEVMLKLASNLKREGLNVHIEMIGTGTMADEMKKQAVESDLTDYISFAGAKTPDEVRKMMLQADIFVSTSDHKEGWGAVVNEAMNSGCVTVAAKDIGVAPYLINDGENGFMYKACDVDKLTKIVRDMCINRDRRYSIGSNAYATIKNEWCAEVAAGRLYEFISDPEHDMDRYKEGPVSRA